MRSTADRGFPLATRDNGRVTPAVTRRDARAARLLTGGSTPARHARVRRAAWIRTAFTTAAALVLGVGGAASVTAAVVAPPLVPASSVHAAPQLQANAERSAEPVPLPAAVEALPAPTVEAAQALVDICAIPAVVEALAVRDDTRAIAASGGADVFRAAVASGTAPCVSLSDPAHVWVVVNKARPYDPLDYRPSPLVDPVGIRDLSGGDLRQDAAAALAEMAGAAMSSGAGEIAVESAFRSYATQRSTYGNLVSARGRSQADLVSARPGHSEHQSGLAVDVTACTPGCLALHDFAGTTQQQWVAAHSWEFGWIVRYAEGGTGVTGYSPEPWHLRYIGRELAQAYHDGGWRSLEEFFGLPAGADYGG